MNNSTNLIGNTLIVAALSLCVTPLLRPKIFKRQDILLIIAFFISGLNLLFKGKYLDELPQFSLILLAATSIFYTVESIRLRIKNPQ
ncbi:Ycf66 family protein [Nostoc sp. MG11]|uniref:Ycf66 family protein n=1 Tax=Nostoc sp. MG11 TaxID=2721166 RepID=UPI001867DEC7|nr:Ycf66 family protein [Nostoc sp. MG11]